MDEGIGALDADFLDCVCPRLDTFVNRTVILVFASHNEALLSDSWDLAPWLDTGRIMAAGPAREVLAAYRRGVRPSRT